MMKYVLIFSGFIWVLVIVAALALVAYCYGIKKKIMRLPIVRVTVNTSERKIVYGQNGTYITSEEGETFDTSVGNMMYQPGSDYIISRITDSLSVDFLYNGRKIVKENVEFDAPMKKGKVFREYAGGDSFNAYYSQEQDKLYRCSDYEKENRNFNSLYVVIALAVVVLIGLSVAISVIPAILPTLPFGFIIVVFAAVIYEMITLLKNNRKDTLAIQNGRVLKIPGSFVGYKKEKHESVGKHRHTYYTYHPVILYTENERKYFYIDGRNNRRKGNYFYRQNIALYQFTEEERMVMEYKDKRDFIYYAVMIASVIIVIYNVCMCMSVLK